MVGPAHTASGGENVPEGLRGRLSSGTATESDSLDKALTRARVAAALFGDTSPPRTLGRFLVQGRLGAGAMGVVWAAWDPRLERRVAIKRIARIARDPALDEHRKLRLIREAQVLAKLSHPNIVAVYEIDEGDEHAHIVMELVEGQTLAEATAKTRDRATIVGWYVQAARGLAAAHAAGVVHRDFKPANVLLGDDGRVRVADFGLANTTTMPSVETTTTGVRDGASSDAKLSVAVAGTPAYMSPEVMRGEPATSSSDQYALSVSLWEALTGARPPSEEAMKRGSALPRSLRRALLRGLDVDPARRWPDLEGWIAEVSGEAKRRRLWRSIPVVALGTLGVAFSAATISEVRLEAACDATAAELRARLSPESRAKLTRVIEDTGAANAREIAARTLVHLEAAIESWARAHGSACRDAASFSSARSQRGRSVLSCLDQRRLRIEAVADAVDELDATTAPKMVVAAASVRTDACSVSGRDAADDDTDTGPSAGTPEATEHERESLVAIARVESLLRLGRYVRASEVALEARTRATQAEMDRTASEPDPASVPRRRRRLVAELDYVLALAASGAGDARRALDHAESAYGAALASGADVFAAKVAARAAWIAASDVGDLDDARRWVQLAEATKERTGRSALVHSPDLEQSKGLVAFLAGDVLGATRHFARAAGGKARALGFDHPDVSDALNNLAIAFEELGERPLARATYQRVLETYELSYGAPPRGAAPDQPGQRGGRAGPSRRRTRASGAGAGDPDLDPRSGAPVTRPHPRRARLPRQTPL
jgi:tRNA A-37 threonylcarbamoyl transferase component Bud32/tetratricopeptide (TPR) repeat protein